MIPMTDKEQTETSGPLPPQEEKLAKAKAPKSTSNQLLNWLVMVVLGYGIYDFVVNPNASDGASKATPAAEGAAPTVVAEPSKEDFLLEKLYTQERFNSLDKVFSRLRTQSAGRVLQAGEGRNVFCGQVVTYRELNGSTQTLRLDAVADATQQKIVWGLVGARVGEVREVSIPESDARDPYTTLQTKTVSKVVEVLSAAPEVPKIGEMPLQRLIRRAESGYDLRCGDQAVAHLTLWNGKGKLLFSSLGQDPVYFRLGEGKAVPFGLELAAQEMGAGGKYTAIIPAEIAQPLQAGAQAPLPKGLQAQPFPAKILQGHEGILIVDLDFVNHLPMQQEAPKELPMPKL